MKKLILVLSFFFTARFLSAQNNFDVTCKDNLNPLAGFQMPDSTFRLLCTQKNHASDAKRMYLVDIDKYGVKSDVRQILIPDCIDNYPQMAHLAPSGETFISGYSVGCTQPMLHFLLMINYAGDSVKYIEHSPNHSLWEGAKLIVQNNNGIIATANGNKVVYYSSVGVKIAETDSLDFKINAGMVEYEDSFLVISGQKNNSIVILKISKQGDVKLLDSIPVGYYYDENRKFELVRSIKTLPFGDIVITYKKWQVSTNTYTNFIRVLNGQFQLKWEKQIGGLQKRYYSKTEVLQSTRYFLDYIQESQDTLANANVPSNLTLIYHLNDLGNIVKTDTIECKSCHLSSSSILQSVIRTSDDGLFLTYSCALVTGSGSPDPYVRNYTVIKSDSNNRVNFTTSFSSIHVLNDINLYPNPNSTGLLHLRFPEEYSLSQQATLTIWNALGQQVKTVSGTLESLQQVNMEDVQPGCYAVELITENGRYKSKLLVSGE